MASKRKASAMANAASEEPVDPADELKFLCLGGGNEVGRSCHIIQYKGKTVMVSIYIASLLRITSWNAELCCSLTRASTPHMMGCLHFRSSTFSTLALSTYFSSASKSFEPSWKRAASRVGGFIPLGMGRAHRALPRPCGRRGYHGIATSSPTSISVLRDQYNLQQFDNP